MISESGLEAPNFWLALHKYCVKVENIYFSLRIARVWTSQQPLELCSSNELQAVNNFKTRLHRSALSRTGYCTVKH